MSVFGDLDMTKVKDNPFVVGEDTYPAVCTDIKVYSSREEGGPDSVVFHWKIDDPGNKYHGKTLKKYYTLFTKPFEEYTDDPETIGKYEEQAAFLNMLLRDGFDLSQEEIVNLESWSELLGSRMYLKVVNNEGTGRNEGKTFSNINMVMSERRYEEKFGKAGSDLGF